MEKPKRKPLAGLYDAIKRIRELPPDPKIIEEFNELKRKDEDLEKRQREKVQRKKIARDPEAET